RAAGARFRRGADVRSDGACRGRHLCSDIVYRLCRRAPAEVASRQAQIARGLDKRPRTRSSGRLDVTALREARASHVLATAAVVEPQVALVEVVLIILLVAGIVLERAIAAVGAGIAGGGPPSDIAEAGLAGEFAAAAAPGR